MFILLNGAFGIGKSAVARELRNVLAGAAIANPEWIGVLLQRGLRRHRSDFQHDPLWRRLAVRWARLVGRRHAIVIVPMAFSDPRFLEEIRAGLAASGRPVLHFCLTAPIDVVRDRLARRGEPARDPRWAWVHRRAAECCEAHGDEAFAEQVPAVSLAPREIASRLAERVRAA